MAPDNRNIELSVSRINRLMRPLRIRCDALAVLTSSTQPAKGYTTYSTRHRRSRGSLGAESPPLEILQPPGSITSRTHFSKYGTERLEMSRKIYAVRDSFKDIVTKTNPRDILPKHLGNGIVALSAMCSIVIGANLRREVDEFDEDDGTNFINKFYEAVPLEYRRWMVLSHALNLIRDTNIQDATLFTILFDVTTSHGLFIESESLLRSLLSIAFSSTTTSTSPIAHPAHTTFILDLRTRWTEGGLQDPTFLSIVIQALSSTQDIGLWTCKAVKKFAYIFCHTNVTLFMRFLTVFSTNVTGADEHIRSNRSGKDIHAARLYAQLYKWVKLVFDQLFSTSNHAKTMQTTVETSDAILEFLKTCFMPGLLFKPAHRSNDDILLKDLQGAIISLTTYWLSGPFSSTYTSDLALIVNRICVIEPETSTYDLLVEGLFTGPDFYGGRQTLSTIAEALKLHSLPRLEASMWSCALRFIEVAETERHFITAHSVDLFNQFRNELIETVEDAECRCFGQRTISVALTPTSTRKRCSDASSRGIDQGWKWEPLVDDWIRHSACQTSTKKRRPEVHHWLSSTRLRHFSSHSKAKTMLRQTNAILTQPTQVLDKGLSNGRQKYKKPIPLPRHRHSWNVPNSPEGNRETDYLLFEESTLSTHRLKGDGKRTLPTRRPSNFASLVADAVTRRTELHVVPHLPDGKRDPYATTNFPECPDSSPLRVGANISHAIYPPSDDSLDLFAYDQTSTPSVLPNIRSVDL